MLGDDGSAPIGTGPHHRITASERHKESLNAAARGPPTPPLFPLLLLTGLPDVTGGRRREALAAPPLPPLPLLLLHTSSQLQVNFKLNLFAEASIGAFYYIDYGIDHGDAKYFIPPERAGGGGGWEGE